MQQLLEVEKHNMSGHQALEGHLNTFTVNGGVGTVATVGSTAADAGAGDQRDDNIRQINNISLDVASLNKAVSDLITKLRDNRLIQI